MNTINGLREVMRDIFELAQTDLPLTEAGYDQQSWDNHRLRRIETMAWLALNRTEDNNNE